MECGTVRQSHLPLPAGCDGANIHKGFNVVILGLKNIHPDGRTPLTKLRNVEKGDDDQLRSRVQSPENQFVLKLVCGSETKKMMDQEFKPLIRQLAEETALAEQGKPSGILPPGCKAAKCTMNCDMSAAWKIVGTGGAMKVSNQACHCCAVADNELMKPSFDYQGCEWCREWIA